jgi:hypothetical protein
VSVKSPPIARQVSRGPSRSVAAPAARSHATRLLQAKYGNQAVLRARASATQIAGEGVSDASGGLPHAARIQAAFGRYDVSGVRAAIGGRAGAAAARLGASAYATDERIAFRSAPDVHTAAHEAAHVIQQRRGIELPGGVGQPGDQHERMADAVADAVVAGRSAEALLDGGRGPRRPTVQLQCECGGTCSKCRRSGAPSVQLKEAPLAPAPAKGDDAREIAMLKSLVFASTVLANAPALSAADEALLKRLAQAVPIYDAIKQRKRVDQETDVVRQGMISQQTALERERGLDHRADGGYSSRPGGVLAEPAELEAMGREVARGEALVASSGEDIQRSLRAQRFSDADEVIRLVEVSFPELWQRRAKALALTRLELSRRQVAAEQKKYTAGDSIRSLRAADAELSRLAKARSDAHRSTGDKELELAELTSKRTRMGRLRDDAQRWGLPGGVPPSAEELAQLDAEIETRRETFFTTDSERSATVTAFDEARVRLGGQHPFLHTRAYVPGMFARSSDAEITAATRTWTDEILENIEKTRGNIADDTIKVWDLNDIPDQTYNSLGVPADSSLADAVNAYVAGKRSSARWLSIAQSVLEVGLIIGATLLNPIAGAALAVAFSAGHLAADVAAYKREQAAEQTHVVPELADISANDPDWLAIVIDVVSLGIDIFQLGGATLRALRNLREVAKGVRAGTRTAEELQRAARAVTNDAGKATVIAERATRRVTIRGAATRMAAARDWVARTFRNAGGLVLDLSELAIARLRSLPKKVLDWLRGLKADVLQLVLGCASPCKVDLDEIIRLFREAEAKGLARGPVLQNADELLDALPAGIKRTRIASKLAKHPGYMAGVTEAGLTAEDMKAIAGFLTEADRLGVGSSYRTFTKFINQAIAARIGKDPKKLLAVLEKMHAAQAQGASSSSRGAIFEAWVRANVKFPDDFVRLTTYVKGQRVTADRWVASLGEVWDMKAYLPGSRVDVAQAQLYNQLVNTLVQGSRVKSINYLFLSQAIAEANQAMLRSKGLNFRIFYLDANNALVRLP